MNDITPTMTHRHITPRIAKTMLSHNTGNRPLRKAVVQRYATDMENGDWQDNGDPIRFDTNGRLIDGSIVWRRSSCRTRPSTRGCCAA